MCVDAISKINEDHFLDDRLVHCFPFLLLFLQSLLQKKARYFDEQFQALFGHNTNVVQKLPVQTAQTSRP